MKIWVKVSEPWQTFLCRCYQNIVWGWIEEWSLEEEEEEKKSLTRCFAFFLTSIFFLDGFASCGPGWTIVYLEIPGLGSSGPTELRPQVLRRNSWDAAGDTPFNVSFIPIDNFISTVFHIKKVAVKKLFGKVPENDISRRLKKYKSHNG